MVSPVTLSLREKIKGVSSTPSLSCLARRKGEWLNAGSSAMDKSLAVIPPESSASLSSPSFTALPSAAVIRDSSIGRKVLASINAERASRTTSTAAKLMPAQMRMRFTAPSRPILAPLESPRPPFAHRANAFFVILGPRQAALLSQLMLQRRLDGLGQSAPHSGPHRFHRQRRTFGDLARQLPGFCAQPVRRHQNIRQPPLQRLFPADAARGVEHQTRALRADHTWQR